MKSCEHCGKKIPDGRKSNAIYCSDACKTEAHRVRHNIPRPDFLEQSKPITVSNEVRNLLSEEDKAEQRIIRLKIDNLEQAIKPILEIYKELDAARLQYEIHGTIPEKFKRYRKKLPTVKKPVNPLSKLQYSDKDFHNDCLLEEKYNESVQKYLIDKNEYSKRPLTIDSGIGRIFIPPPIEPNKPFYMTRNFSEVKELYNVFLSDWKSYEEYLSRKAEWEKEWKNDNGVRCGIQFINSEFKKIKEKVDLYQSQIVSLKNSLNDKYAVAEKQIENQVQAAKEVQKDSRKRGADVAKLKFKTYSFSPEWSELLGKPSKPFSMMIFGDAKAGKSFFSVSFAQYLTVFGDVAYFPIEEKLSDTFQRKILATSADDIFTFDVDTLADIESVLSENHYEFAFIDSVTAIGINSGDFRVLKEKFPKTSFVAILQTTKNNAFAGEKAWKHDVGAIIQVTRPADGVRSTRIICAETRYGGGGEKIINY